MVSCCDLVVVFLSISQSQDDFFSFHFSFTRSRNWVFFIPEATGWSSQSILKEISPKYSLEGLMLRLQYFGHLIRRTDSLEKTLMLGKFEGRRRRGQKRMTWLDGHEFEQVPGVGDGEGSLSCCSPWGCKELDMTEWLNWTELNSREATGC